MSRPTSALRRAPFADGDTDGIVAFCAANGGVHDTRMLLGLTSDPAGVFVITDDEGIALVATVVDRTRNAADAAILETLGVRARMPPHRYTELVLQPAIAFARSGERGALHVELAPAQLPADGAEAALLDAGFARAYDSFEMRRPRSAPSVAAPEPLPPGWAWSRLDLARADAAHAALGEMFKDAVATHLIPVTTFREGIATGTAIWHVLQHGDRIAGLIRIVAKGNRGQLRILGRVPAYRGQGLGPRLVAEGLRLLNEAGAGEVELSVDTANEGALDLYRRFGFEVVSRAPVFGLALR
jgi:ribosomal protein S18 acetylase RimI-like enzyme